MRDWWRLGVLGLVLTAAACGSGSGTGARGGAGGGGTGAGGAGGTGAGGAGVGGTGTGGGQGGSGTPASCALSQPFKAAVQVVVSTSMSSEEAASVSVDGLTAIVSSQANHNIAAYSLNLYTRSTLDGTFDNPQPLAVKNGSLGGQDPRLTRNGLSLYWDDVTPSQINIWVATRPSTMDPFDTFSALPATINSTTENNIGPWISSDGGRLYFGRNHALYVSTITAGQFGTPVAVSELNAGGTVLLPVLTDDERTIYFASDRQIGASAPSYFRVVTSSRASRNAAWATPSAVSELDNGDDMVPTDVSPDGCLLYVVDTDRNQTISRIKQAAKPSL